MTNEQREQVVELLRCAADETPDGLRLNGMFDAASGLGVIPKIDALSWSALLDVRVSALLSRGSAFPVEAGVDEGYRLQLLEAAQRVEDREWP